MPGEIRLATNARGYERDAELQRRFDEAKVKLLAADGYNGELCADLVLGGGGIKGIGLVGAVLVLAEAGYRFRCVAGTSAGAIVGSVVAAMAKADRPMVGLKTHLDTLDYTKFTPGNIFQRALAKLPFHLLTYADWSQNLLYKDGVYSGDYLYQWLTPILQGLGVNSFSDLTLTEEEDPDQSLGEGRNYRLLVHTSDITRRRLARLPWDYHFYGVDAAEQRVDDAVRASMSIPLFFKPVTFAAKETTVWINGPGGRLVRQTYEGGTVTWVDGGLLRNFPIDAFERIDGKPPRFPTIGIKLAPFPDDVAATEAFRHSWGVGIGTLETAVNEWDTYEVEESTAGRTIFVSGTVTQHGKAVSISPIDFGVTKKQANELFLNGVHAATDYVIDAAEFGGVPRDSAASRRFVSAQA